jgi:hypothetical protein
MLVPPLLDKSKLTSTCFGLVMLATMFTAIYAMSEKRYFRLVVIFDSGYVLRYLVECLHELIFRHAAGVRFQHRFALHHFFDHASSLALQRQRRSRQNCRGNLIAAYLMLGIIWSLLYGMVEFLAPGSFTMGGEGSISADGGDKVKLLYFTLTTLGYGDVSPVLPFAQRAWQSSKQPPEFFTSQCSS